MLLLSTSGWQPIRRAILANGLLRNGTELMPQFSSNGVCSYAGHQPDGSVQTKPSSMPGSSASCRPLLCNHSRSRATSCPNLHGLPSRLNSPHPLGISLSSAGNKPCTPLLAPGKQASAPPSCLPDQRWWRMVKGGKAWNLCVPAASREACGARSSLGSVMWH